jgi:LuxR family maltose regulon positive regulatory protein
MSAVASFPHDVDDSIVVPPPTVLLTKLYPPRLRTNLVARTELIAMLNGDPDRRLTVICAPAGYGKSTLVAQWLLQAETPSSWVSLEASDNQPRVFFNLIVAALRSIDRGLMIATKALLAHPGSFDIDTVVERLIADLSVSTRSFALVLDDYQKIEAPEIHRAIGTILEHLPMTMRVVLISRTEPPLRLARFAAGGELVRLDRSDLQFTPAEALRYYQDGLGLDVAPGEVELLHQRTEGWAAGIHLIGVALRGKPRNRLQRFIEEYIGDIHFGDQYLWEEVLQSLPDDIQSFLLRTSILDRLTAGLCDAVTETQDGADMIGRCERDNLFIVPLDDKGEWYRYHHLFADVLRDRLTQTVTDDELDGLHRRASQWLERHGPLEDAIRHAIAGHAWDQAVRLLEEHCAALSDRDQIATMRIWLEGLPPDVLGRSPRLAFWLAWSLGRSGQWNEGARPLRIAEEIWAATGDRTGRGSLLLWHAGRAVYSYDSRQAVELATHALELLPEDRPTERLMALMCQGIAYLYRGEPVRAEQAFADVRMLIDAKGLTWFHSFEMTYSAAVLAQKGNLVESTALCRRVLRSAGEMPVEIWVQPALRQLGENYLEWGELEEARHCFQRADDLAEWTRSSHWRARVRIGLARIAWARGEIEEAFDEIERAADYGNQSNNNLQDVRNARAWQARIWLASRQLALARLWADSCELDPYLPPQYERQVEHLTYARLLIQEGQPDLAIRILEKMHQRAEEAGRSGDLVEISILTALAHKTRGNPADALESLHHALVLGEPNGYFRVFVEEGEELAPLLRNAAARGSHRDYARRLLSDVDETVVAPPPGRSGASEALSEREVEVLRLVAAGLPNRDIGERLFISEKTVKKHLTGILNKLTAANRTQAVDLARRRGLI